MKSVLKNRLGLLFALFVVVTALPAIRSVLLGGIPFWYDPARDLLLALENLHKPSLIGPPSGIPGVFYLPYWTWLLALPLIISKDPRFVTFCVITLPYLTVFPFLLWKLRKTLGEFSPFIIWSLFISSFDSYTTFIWSPSLAPLVLLVVFYLLTKTEKPFLIGFLSVLVAAFNFSFGVVVAATAVVFFLIFKRNKVHFLLAGIFLALIPTLVFEARHGFGQIRSFLNVFIASALYNSAVVGQTGFSKAEIISQFGKVLSQTMHLSLYWTERFILIAAGYLAYLWSGEKLHFEHGQVKPPLFLGLLLFFSAFVFLTTKNPVWSYYFIGIELVFLLLLTFLTKGSKLLTAVLLVWTIMITFFYFQNFLKNPTPNFLLLPTLASKKYIVEEIYKDTNQKPFTYFAYSPAIYTFDFDYLFLWHDKRTSTDDKNVYLIIPPTTKAIEEDFINYKTPGKNFITILDRTFPDGTRVLRRITK